MSSNIIVPLPKKSDAPSEKVEKESGDLDDTKEPLVTNIDTVYKEGKSRKMWLKKPTHLICQKNNIDTVNKTNKSQTSKETFHN